MLSLTLAALALASGPAAPQATLATVATERTAARLDLIPANALLVGWVENVRTSLNTIAGNQFYEFAREHPEVLRQLNLEFPVELLDLFGPEATEEKLQAMDGESRLAHQLLALSTGGASAYLSIDRDLDFVGGMIFEIEGSVPAAAEILREYWSGDDGEQLKFTQRGDLLIGASAQAGLSPSADRWAVLLGHDTLVWLFSESEERYMNEIERLALRMAGGDADELPFSESAILGESTRSLRLQGGINGLVNLEWPMAWLRDLVENEDSWSPVRSGSPQERFILQSGLLDMRWMRASAAPGPGELLDFEFQVHVPDGSLLGVAADQFGPLPTDLLDRLPGDALSLLGVNYDIASLLFSLYDAFETLEGDLSEIIADQLALASEIAGVDIEEEFLAQFTGRMVRAVDTLASTNESDVKRALRRNELPSTWAVEVRDPETVWANLEDLGYRVSPDLELETVDVGGYEVVQPVEGLLNRYWVTAGPLGRGYAVFGTTQERTVGVLDAFLAPTYPEAGAEPLRRIYREFAGASVLHTARTPDVLRAGFELWQEQGYSRQDTPEGRAREDAALRAINTLSGTFTQIGDRVPLGLAYRLRMR